MAKETRSYSRESYTEERISAQGIGQTAGEKGSMTVVEAGKRGGEKTAQTHGHEFYQEIGQKGGKKGGRVVRELIEEGKRSLATKAETGSNPKRHSAPRRET
jgi:general stress protein YciG